ncbi:MAG TPA: TatD family hydrolase [Candidatus Paceibacterota bacterium]|nr:TatD family hydrolase [Candidatus Paceibacterota bacterium]
MDLKFFDAHCHLQLSQFDIDRAEVLERMEEGHFGGVVVGVDFATSREALELAEQYGFLWAAVGLHPHDNVAEEFDMTIYRELAADPKVVAIGECGLDYFRSGTTDEERDAQKHRFESQIALAVEVGKPLIIHCRDAHDDMLAILKEHTGTHPELKVIIHFFTGTGELAQQYLDLGCYLSFPGPITYADMYDESIRVAPLDKILSETDSPFAAPVPFRGKRNEPVYVEEVVKKIAAIKGVSVDAMAAQILENAKKVFGV